MIIKNHIYKILSKTKTYSLKRNSLGEQWHHICLRLVPLKRKLRNMLPAPKNEISFTFYKIEKRAIRIIYSKENVFHNLFL